MDNPLAQQLERNGDRVRAVLNLLLESPYFYKTDNPDMFNLLRRNEEAFAQFFLAFYDWKLIIDSKCARVYKQRWYNEQVTEANRDVFRFSKRDECIAFMLLLEFFEHQLEEYSLTIEDENLRFQFGDLLGHVYRRFGELYPQRAATYTEEFVRANILRPMIPDLIRYRFLAELPRPKELRDTNDTIYEALPALYHYNPTRLSQSVNPAAVIDPVLENEGENLPADNGSETEEAGA